MTLAETLALFHASVTSREEADPRARDECFVGSEEFPAADRLGVYSNMWLFRQVAALEAEFPKVARCLGDERFHEVCEAYVRAHPSEHHDIGKLGRRLPAFLRRHPVRERPDLADLAELEWARSEIFVEARSEVAGREALAALSPEEFPRARLAFVPALRPLRLGHGVTGLWRRIEGGEEPGPVEPGPAHLAVWRSGHEVFHAALEPDEASALRTALTGGTLEAVCARFSGRAQPASAAFGALASWLDEGWVAAVR